MKFNLNIPQYVYRFLLPIFFSIVSLQAIATPELLTLQSRIIKPDGSPLETSSTSFRISITDPVGTCVVYQEDFSAINLSGTKGLATLNVGAGTKAYPAGPLSMTQIFDNSTAANFVCQAGGNYDPGTTDKRKLVMQFNDGSGWQTLPAMSVNAVPFSLHAANANTLSGLSVADLVQVSNVPTCVGGEALHFNGTSFTCVAVSGGSGSVSSVTSANTDIAITNTTTTPQLTLNVGTGNNQIVKLNGSAELPAVSGVNLTALNAANLGSGTVPAARMPALTGDIEMTAGTTATSIAAGAIVDADINASAAIARSKIAAEGGAGAGNVLVNDGSGNISSLQCNNNEVIKFNGAGVATCGADNGGTGDIANGGNTGAVTIGTNDATDLTLETDNSPRLSILANGNVGIGTASPSSKLHVEATGTVVSALVGTGNSSTAAAYNQVLRSNGGLQYGWDLVSNLSYGNDELSIREITGGSVSTRFTMLKGGNVGIGTTNPTSKLSVSGIGEGGDGVSASSATGALILRPDGTNGNTIRYGGSGGNSSVLRFLGPSDTEYARIDGTQLTSQGGLNIVGGYVNLNSIRALDRTGADLEINKTGSVNGTILLYTSSAGAAVERMRIDTNGNVGIGTNNPQRLLHMAGPMRITPTTVPAAPAAGDIYVDSGDANKLKYHDGSGWVTAGGGGGGGGVSEVTSANADIGITNTTTTPQLTLNVGTGNNQIVKLNGSAQLPAVSGVNLTALNATNIASGTIDAARLPALANAQIDNAAAIARSKLASGSNDHVLINDGSGVMSSEAQLAVSRGGTGLGSFTNNALLMANGTGTAVTNGICTTIGDVLMWTGTAWACTSLAGSAQGYFKDGGNTFTGTATVGTNSNHNLEIETNSVTRMTVDNSGNVGIGTTSSGSKLEVAGNIRQSSGQLTTAPYNNIAAVAFDLNNGNMQYTSANCQAMTLTNMQDGGTYTIAVKGTAAGTCSFSHAGLNFWYSPAMGPSANGSQTTYTFVRMGSDVYVSWISLYQ